MNETSHLPKVLSLLSVIEIHFHRALHTPVLRIFSGHLLATLQNELT